MSPVDDSEIDDPLDRLSRARLGPVRVAAVDAEQLRNSVAARLFGAAAHPVKIGRFTVLERLGAGGMGVVYSAYDTQLDRKVAIKLLRGVDDQGAHHARLRREAQALAKLSHPNVVQVFELGSWRGQVFVAMEFIQGQTLSEWKSESTADVLAVFGQAGEGLAAAHRAGLIHRDFKPDNVLVGDDGRVRVLDFGLARSTNELPPSTEERAPDPEPDPEPNPEPDPEPAASSKSGSRLGADLAALRDSASATFESSLTATGTVLGTPAYMAPEQHLGGHVDARSDQFGFCVALWEKLYGERPFAGADRRSLVEAVVHGDLREPEPAGVPAHVRRALERALTSDPDLRWPDMDSLLAALARAPRRRGRWIAGGLAVAVVALGLGAWGLTRDPGPGPCDGGERELAGVWDTRVQTDIQRAFSATETPFADDAWTGTARLLDAYAEQWQTTHREVCEASVVRKEESPELFGRKMVCLGQRLTELELLTQLLVEADADVVSRAVVAAGSLSRIEACADEAALLDAPIDDPRMEELERMLVSANGRKALAKYEQAAHIAAEAVTLARDIGTARGEGRALVLVGGLQAHDRKPDAAELSLREALRRADVAGDDATRVQALIQLMWVAYIQHDLEAGAAVTKDAKAALDRLGDAPLLEADFSHYAGLLALARRDFKTAERDFARTITIRQTELGDDHPEVAIAMSNVANAWLRDGEHAKAEAIARRALAIFESKLGADHPYTASSHNNIGNSLLEQGRHLGWDDPDAARPFFDRAAGHYADAIRIRVANFGDDHVLVAILRHNLGEAQRFQGNYSEARATWERSLAVKLEHYGGDHPSVTMTMTGLGRVLLRLGETDAALELLEGAAANREARPGSEDATAEVLYALAQAVRARALADSDRSARRAGLARAGAIARDALTHYEAAGKDYAGERREVAQWVETHAGPAPLESGPESKPQSKPEPGADPQPTE